MFIAALATVVASIVLILAFIWRPEDREFGCVATQEAPEASNAEVFIANVKQDERPHNRFTDPSGAHD